MSWHFLVDEDLPRSTAITLQAAGYEAENVRDVGLRVCSDQAVYEYAQATGAVLISADRGFANMFRFPLRAHGGIIVLGLAENLPSQQLSKLLVAALATLAGESLGSTLVIVEAGRLRVRRAEP